MLTNMDIIEDAFTTSLGVKTYPFTLTGSKSECDAKIKAKCEKVEETLKNEVWDFTATFVIREYIPVNSSREAICSDLLNDRCT